MTLERRLRDLVARFSREVLDNHVKHLECFCQHGVQVEGWLKGELLCFLDNEKAEGRISDFGREVPVGGSRKRVDFRIKIATTSGALEEAWVELKHWLIGYQAGSQYNASFYFGDPSSVGIRQDVKKLRGLPPSKGKFVLILATANPGAAEWAAGVDKFNRKFAPPRLKSLTDPAEFPNSYFLGLLRVSVEAGRRSDV